ncbi:MAG: J domain-containing protein [Planctomycetota bacterium]|nr:MAG: J domain-containing protein [Planctomycetota bacterium]
MDVVVVTIIGAVLCGLWSARGKGRGTQTKFAASATLQAYIPPAIARREVIRYLTARGCTLVNGEGECDAFRRGEYLIRRLRGPGSAPWLAVPAILVAVCYESQRKLVLHMRISLDPLVTASASGAGYFQEQARAEFSQVLGYLSQIACEYAQRPGEQKRRRRPNHRWYTGNEERPRAQEAPRSADPLDADLAVLGLKRGASSDEVKRAYREACRKYHPDRLNGQNVEPHLVELAVQRFKEVTAAYQRLRERMAQHA